MNGAAVLGRPRPEEMRTRDFAPFRHQISHEGIPRDARPL
jgi:hypothetical protein